MCETVRVVTSSSVTLTVTNSLSEYSAEKRFQKDLTVAELKQRLELVTGVSPGTMKLELYDKNGTLVTQLDSDDSLLGSYPADDGMHLHVIGKGPKLLDLEGVPADTKFDLSAEEYSKRGNTLRSYLMKNKLGKYSEQPESEQKEPPMVDVAPADIVIGNRCEISVPGQPPKRGQVKYVGTTHFKPGIWVGVQYDEPLGKNDGTVDGKEYFKCPPKYGGFVRPSAVTVGDFPEEDLEIDEM